MPSLMMSDIHGHVDALQAFDRLWRARLRDFDHIIVLGDLVDYGPCPHEVIDWVRTYATDVVRGNHDHAMATGASCQSSPRYLEAAMATRDHLRSTLTRADLAYLSDLEITRTVTGASARWQLVHATPHDPLFDYLPPDSDDSRWIQAFGRRTEDHVMVGHTHLAFAKRFETGLVINPGSLGMPKDGHPGGSFAIVHGSCVQFLRLAYDTAAVIDRLKALDLPSRVFAQLAARFRTGW